eukprot:1190652-Prorocentrum_minimum.AAC.5
MSASGAAFKTRPRSSISVHIRPRLRPHSSESVHIQPRLRPHSSISVHIHPRLSTIRCAFARARHASAFVPPSSFLFIRRTSGMYAFLLLLFVLSSLTRDVPPDERRDRSESAARPGRR